jgi:hypothetical protein
MNIWTRGRARGGGGGGSQYIPQLCIIKEYIRICSSVRCNRGIYFYIPWYRRIYLHIFIGVIFLGYFVWLIKEYNIYSSVMKVCLSVIPDERVCVSCSWGGGHMVPGGPKGRPT